MSKDNLKNLSPALLELMARKLKKNREQPTGITQKERKGEVPRFPLSYPQQRLWFLDQYQPNSAGYNIVNALVIKGNFSVEAMQEALNKLLDRHEILRTTYAAEGAEPVQLLNAKVKASLVFHDVCNEQDAPAVGRALLEKEAQAPFNLTTGPLIRATVVKLGQEEHVLCLVVHHIASDGWSNQVMMRDIQALYESGVQGTPAHLPELTVQYADYAVWQREFFGSQQMQAKTDFWRNQLADTVMLEMPLDRPRPSTQVMVGRLAPIHLPKALCQQMNAFNQIEQATPFMTLFAGFTALLSRYSGQQDIVMGVPFANRKRPELLNLIGFFINTLPLRVRFSENDSFRSLVGKVRDVSLAAEENQDIPFEKLLADLEVPRDPSHTPLYQAVFNLGVNTKGAAAAEAVSMAPFTLDTGVTKFDLTVDLIETDEGVQGHLSYAPHLFDQGTIERLMAHFENLLVSALALPDLPLKALQLLTPGEWNLLATGGHGLPAGSKPDDLMENTCLHQLFEAQVVRHPLQRALVYQGETLNYRQLNEDANRVAHFLLQRGIGNNSAVGLCLDRSTELLVCLLGILKTGALYVPMDPNYPKERLTLITEDARMNLVLVGEKTDLSCAESVVYRREHFAHQPCDNLDVAVSSQNGAYIIYTSGSSGRPKGVLIPHSNVGRLFAATQNWFSFNEQDVWTLFHSPAFDFSVWEIWGALLYGGTLVIVPYLVSRSPEEFRSLLSHEGVTVLCQSPTAFRQLVELDQERPGDSLALRYVIFGAEALEVNMLSPWFDRYGDAKPLMVNMYGITETTVHVTYRVVTRADASPAIGSPIGEKIPDLGLFVLDKSMGLLPFGAAGEIFVGGAGLARGYIGRPALTAERFLPNPYASYPGERLYRSGDGARITHHGELRFMGRVDNQLKIRGFRIEPGEIQTVVAEHPLVKQCLVAARRDDEGQPRLVAYLVLEAGASLHPDSLRSYLAARLPAYMVPAYFLMVDSFSLTAHGKLDRAALERLPLVAPKANRGLAQGQDVLPMTETEELLLAVWTEALGIEELGVNDNFFSLGGDSILSVRVLALAKKRGMDFSLQQLFQFQTIRELARAIYAARDGVLFAERPVSAPFSLVSAEIRSMLPESAVDAYPMAQLQLGMIYHMELEADVLPYHNVNSWRLKGIAEEAPFRQATQAVFHRHPIFRTSFHLSTYGLPLQVVHREPRISVVFEDLRGRSAAEQSAIINAYAAKEQKSPFNLAQPPLVKFALHRLEDNVFGFTVTECHAILDGWSYTSALAEIFNLYLRLLDGEQATPDSPPRMTYRDYIALERATIEAGDSTRFWQQRLAGCGRLNIPRWPMEGPQKYAHQATLTLSDDTTAGLRRIAGLAHVPFKSVLMAAHFKVLSMVGGRDDVLTGMVINGRLEEEGGDSVYGFFLNSLPIRAKLAEGSYLDLIRQVFQAEWEVLPYRRYPLAMIQKEHGSEPIFEVLFNYVHFYATESLFQSGGITMDGNFDGDEPTHFPLTANFTVNPATFELSLVLQSGDRQYGLPQLEALRGYYARTFEAMIANPDAPHDSCVFISPEEIALTQDCLAQALQSPEAHLAKVLPANLAGARLTLVDSRNKLVPPGCHGELALVRSGANPERLGLTARVLASGVLEWSDPLAVRRSRYLNDLDREKQLAFWKVELAGAPAMIALPYAQQHTSQSSAAAVSHDFTLDERDAHQLLSFALEQGLALQYVLQAVYVAVLARFSGDRELVFGLPVGGHGKTEAEDLENGLINRIAIRAQVDANLSYPELAHQLCETYDRVHAHKDVLYEWLATELSAQQGCCTPLFQVMFLMLNRPSDTLVIPGLTREDGQWASDVDLTLVLCQTAAGLCGRLIYRSDVLSAQMVNRIAEALKQTVALFACEPGTPISRGSLISAQDAHAMLELWNDTKAAFSQELSALDLFEARVRKTPLATALLEGTQTLSYAELNSAANRLARLLQKQGVAPETIVAIYLDRSAEMVISVLAILKAGGAYLPLAASLPHSRLSYMVKDSGVAVILGTRPPTWETDSAVTFFCLNEQTAELAAESSENLCRQILPDNLAYLIYTSGSTGNPKGVMIAHKGLTNYLHRALARYTETPRFGAPLHSPLSFDLTVTSMWLPLLNGTALHILPESESFEEIKALQESLVANPYDFVKMTPTHLDALARIWPDDLPLQTSCFIVGGEALPGQSLAFWHQRNPSLHIINEYGPTETVVGCCVYDAGPGESESGAVPIGRPIANTTLYVLDSLAQAVPPGVVGELYIGGIGLGRAYHRRPALTAERFIPNPFVGSGERLYRTGDRVRHDSLGNLVYLERVDTQVKIRGYRVELGEIEAQLARHPAVREAAVVLWDGNAQGAVLVAYYIPQADHAVTAKELGDFLRIVMPSYMVPTSFNALESFPTTVNGKLDRALLARKEPGRLARDRDFTVAMDPTEEVLQGIWLELFHLNEVSIKDNFFELGGNSLHATQLISRIRNLFQLELPMRALFEGPSIAQLARAVKKEQTRNTAVAVGVIKPSSRTETGHFPLSFAQQRLWFLNRYNPDHHVYNLPYSLRIKGELHRDALDFALRGIIDRHEILRSRFDTVEGDPVQVIEPLSYLPIETTELSLYSEERALSLTHELAGADARKPFDLEKGPLFRFRLIRLTPTDHILVIIMHHIISDGWSVGILVNEFSTFYSAHVSGNQPDLSPLPIQYADFAVWQRQWLQGDVLASQMDYWSKELKGVPEILAFPYDYPRPVIQTYNGEDFLFDLSPELSQKVHRLCRAEGATLFMVLISAFNVLLSRYSGEEDICLGTPIANRNREEIEGLIGFFVNTLVIRARMENNPSYRQLLKQVRDASLGSYANQDLPFESLVEALKLERNLAYTSLFQMSFVLQNASLDAPISIPGLEISHYGIAQQTAKFDLTLTITESSAGMEACLAYNTDLFAPATIANMATHFLILLEGIIAHPEMAIRDLPVVSAMELQQTLVTWNDTARAYPHGKTMSGLFEEMAAQAPQSSALLFEGQVVSYSELDQRANQIAHYLLQQGVCVGDRVAMFMERSVHMIAGMLAVLKVGAAYVPIDPDYPEGRIHYMVEASQVTLVLTLGHLAEKLPHQTTLISPLDQMEGQLRNFGYQSPHAAPDPASAAYMIFTSGSTGHPKLTINSHASALNLLFWMRDAYGLSNQDTFLQKTSISFDVSVWEIFCPLTSGSRMVLAKPEGQKNPHYLADLIVAHGVSIVHFVPMMLRSFVESGNLNRCSSLRKIISGGDVLTPELRDRVLASVSADLHNSYGPTETAVAITDYLITREPSEPVVPLGRPLGNCRIYIHNNQGPISRPGELMIGGVQVGPGYYRKPSLTALKFQPDPYAAEPGSRLYATGDLARYLPNGNLLFLGRIDTQIKLRGFRIELGEIEATLLEHPSVQSAVALLKETEDGDKQIVAFLCPLAGDSIPITEVRALLTRTLPEYMVPASFVTVEKIPLHPNGKINTEALKNLNYTAAKLKEYVAPANAVEHQLVEIWKSLLDLGTIGVEDNFFEIGGHSLTLIKAHQKLREAFETEITVIDMFQYTTIRKLSEFLTQKTGMPLLADDLDDPFEIVPASTDRPIRPRNTSAERARIRSQHDRDDD